MDYKSANCSQLCHFKTFGVIAHVLEKGKNLSKFDSKTKQCIFIGYSLESKAYLLWDPITKKVLKSRDVKFLQEFQENEILNDFINIEVITNSCNKEDPRRNANEEIEREDSEKDFHSANEENTGEHHEDVNVHSEDENRESRAIRFGRGSTQNNSNRKTRKTCKKKA